MQKEGPNGQNTSDESIKLGEVPEDILLVQEMSEKVRAELGKVIVGQKKLMDLLLIALYTRSHVLLEGVPGIAKTLTASLFAKVLNTGFSRIQFTPDLMPSDVIGTNIFSQKISDFEFKRGPIFSNIILVDEINRAPAKTQAALFEAMQEKQVSVDGETYVMDDIYQIIATQNPIDQEGTYKLPEAQLDRFIFKVVLEHPDLDEELESLKRFETDFEAQITNSVKKVLHAEDIGRIRNVVEKVRIEAQLMRYIAEIVHSTRNNGDIYLGASPRASLSILKASKALAAISGRNYVTPDDIRDVTFDVLNHRIILSPEREIEGVPSSVIISQIIKNIEVPR
jgi:MoxR-like ATPase